MYDLNYAKEPFDFKLFFLCFMKKIWIIICAALIGVILVGGGNYLKKVVFAGPVKYEIETSYYVNYNTDPETGAVVTYINEATWESWITMDWFTDRIWTHASELGFQSDSITRENLSEYVSATLLTDVHIPTTYVTAHSPEEATLLNEAVKKTMADFAEHQEEMRSVEVIDETTVQEKNRDDRTVRACILGAVLGAFAACVLLSFSLISDDSVWVPETFTYRYGLPMLGAICKGEKSLSEEAASNLAYRFKKENQDDKFFALEYGLKFEGELPEDFEIINVSTLPETYEKMRASSGVLLLVGAGMCNGKQIEHILHSLKVQECPVKGALLCDADAKLLKCYYLGRKH